MVGLFSQLLSVVSPCPHAAQMQCVHVQLCAVGPTESLCASGVTAEQHSPCTIEMSPLCMIMLVVTKLHHHCKVHDIMCLERDFDACVACRYGVSCCPTTPSLLSSGCSTAFSQSVAVLELNDFNLSGSLPTQLGVFQSLSALSIGDNPGDTQLCLRLPGNLLWCSCCT